MRTRVRTRSYRGERPAYDKRKWLLGKIHSVAKRRGISDQDRRNIQIAVTGRWSCRDMDEHQLVAVLQALQGDEGRAASGAATKPLTPIGEALPYVLRNARHGRDERRPDEPATVEQLHMIEHLWADLGIHASEARLGLSRRICGHPWAQTRAEANKLIEGLKAMRDRGWKAKEAT
jgi:hypothetical protein